MRQQAMFGAGCFWGVEHNFRRIPGVLDAQVGFSGGRLKNPSYKQVCTDKTGHAEVVLVNFNSAKVSYEELLAAFWDMHDPTTLNRQGQDMGTQYRSVIFYFDERQKKLAQKSREELERTRRFIRPIVTEIKPAGKFWRAEEYHQRYFEKNGMKGCHI